MPRSPARHKRLGMPTLDRASNAAFDKAHGLSWVKFSESLAIKPTRYSNFSNLFLEWNSTCFGQFLCASSGVFHCTHSNRYMSYRFADSLWAGAFAPAHKLSANLYILLCVQCKTPDEAKRNCPKHVGFHSKNKSEKLMHLVAFIVRALLRCTVTLTSNFSESAEWIVLTFFVSTVQSLPL